MSARASWRIPTCACPIFSRLCPCSAETFREKSRGTKASRREGEVEAMECRPLGFLLGLPFALVALVLSLVGAVVWVLGTILSCLCPCCICFAGLANLAVDLVKLPVKVLSWFTDQIPC